MGRGLRRLQGACRATALTRHRRTVAAAPAALLVAAIVVGVVVLDQLTKVWAVATLADGPIDRHRRRRRVPADPQHRRRVQPRSRAFTPLLAIARDRARGAPGARAAPDRRPADAGRAGAGARRRARQPRRPHLPVSPGFLRGEVVDFVHVGRFPTFNVADSAITIGAILLIVAALRRSAADTASNDAATRVAEPVRSRTLRRCPRRSRASGSTARWRMLTGWSRAEVQALVDRGRRSLVDGRVVAKSRRLAAGERGRGARPSRRSPAAAPDPDGRRSSCATRTTTWSWSPSPRGSWCTRAPATPRHARERAARTGTRRSPGSATRRGPASCTASTATRAACWWWPAHRPAYDALVEALAAHDVERRVRRAGVGRTPTPPAGSIDAPIGRSVAPPDPHGGAQRGRPQRPHRLRGRATRSASPTWRCSRCRLETGRTHQIRVHLAAIGHPVVGDAAYGGSRPASTSTARSCTPAGSPSPTRSPASRCGWRRSWRPSSPRCSRT